MRYLTQLELKRLTGSQDAQEQFNKLDYLGIPARIRNGATGMALDCQAYDADVIRVMGEKVWELIADDNVGSFFR